MLAAVLLLGVALMGGGFSLIITGNGIGGVVALALGAVTSVMGMNLVILKKLYRRARADLAVVMIGAGGARVIRGGGEIVIPMLRQVVAVSLEVSTIPVTFGGIKALPSADGGALEVEAAFDVRVRTGPAAILAAAGALGE